MIWATVSSPSWFCWLYRTFPSLAAKQIINLISVLTIWWCPCIQSSLVLLCCFILLYFIVLAMPCSLWDLSFPTSNWTQAHNSESTKSWPLDHQRISWIHNFLIFHRKYFKSGGLHKNILQKSFTKLFQGIWVQHYHDIKTRERH